MKKILILLLFSIATLAITAPAFSSPPIKSYDVGIVDNQLNVVVDLVQNEAYQVTNLVSMQPAICFTYRDESPGSFIQSTNYVAPDPDVSIHVTTELSIHQPIPNNNKIVSYLGYISKPPLFNRLN